MSRATEVLTRDDFSRTLDLGCGPDVRLDRLTSGDGLFVGVDVDLGDSPPRSRATLVRADASALPFRARAFDRVIALELLEHVSEPETVVTELSRVSAPGAAVVVAVPTAYSEHVYRRLNRRYMQQAKHVRIFTKRGITRLLGTGGLTVMAADAENFDWSLKWLLHSAAHSRARSDGTILEHLWLSRAVDRIMERARRTPKVARIVAGLEARVGKSRYLLARADGGGRGR